MLIDTDSARLTMTPGECHASYGGTQIRSDLRQTHDTSAIPDGYTRRKDDRILRRSAVCDKIFISAEMNCTAVELNNGTFLRQRLPQRQDSAAHDKSYLYISVSAGRDQIDSPVGVPMCSIPNLEMLFPMKCYC